MTVIKNSKSTEIIKNPFFVFIQFSRDKIPEIYFSFGSNNLVIATA